MFRHRHRGLGWLPRDGLQVEAQVLVTMYEPRGDFQLNVETMRRAGRGALFEAFLRLRERLEKEGLFETEKKRRLPLFPRTIGVVTSRDAAALRDVLTTLKRRDPSVAVVLFPVRVQGEGAAEEIAAALGTAGRRGECEVLLLVRGDGSIRNGEPGTHPAAPRHFQIGGTHRAAGPARARGRMLHVDHLARRLVHP